MNAPDAPPAVLGHAEIRSILLGVLLAMFLGALDQTIVATAMPTIGRELGDVALLPWVVTLYLITATAVTPLYGKAADIFGRRATLLVAVGICIVGSVVCALAPSMLALVAGRAVQGIGGGGLISLAQTTLADLVPPRERGHYQAYFAAVFATASVAGPVIGGFVAEHLSWPLIFWINVPLGILAYAMCDAKLRRLPRNERPHRLDFIGAILVTAATISFLVALSWGGTRHPWASAPVLGLLAVTVGLGALLAYRLRTAPEPLIPLEILKHPIVIRATVASSFAMGTFIGLVIYVPIYFELLVGLSATTAGLALIPFMVGTVSGATFAGRRMMKVVHYKRVTLLGLALATCTVATLGFFPRGLPLWTIEGLLFLTSLGLGTSLPVTLVAVQNVVAPHQLGTATASINFFRQLSGALAVAGFGAILLGGEGGGATRFALRSVRAGSDTGGDFALLFGYVFGAAAVALAIALAMIFLMEERPLRGRAS